MLAAAGAVAALALAGCGSADGKAEAKIPVAATGSLESLAAKVKCTPDMQIDSDEVRQAICKTAAGKFVFATFATDRGQRDWINDAKDYGGFYLVGRKWVAVGTDKLVKTLQTTLGGEEEIGVDHSKHTS
ncbi:lipoprotein [Streptomyces fuscichromogenes]|uniref:Lipoprotein n=2 Tax=Streptomyces fuscichromogenes TaxID=1324013 RepID=A0A917UE94_9ACTN|nr:lipoprotein [Streptomyces fuscichromogenes]